MKSSYQMAPFIAMLLLSGVAGCQKDVENGIRPTVTATTPTNNASGTAISSQITATFSRAMDPSTITDARFTIRKGDALVSAVVTYDASSATAILTPTSALESFTRYEMAISTGAKDLSGKSLASDYQWNFTTASIPSGPFPTVGTTSPGNDAVNVGTTLPVVVSFSEGTDMTTVNILTFLLAKDYTIQGDPAVPGTVTIAGKTATFTPAASLVPNFVYVVTLTKDIKNMTGGSFEGKTIMFTTASN